MKFFFKGSYKNILNIDHAELLKSISQSGVLIKSTSKKSNVGHIDIDGFSIRTILKTSDEIDNSNKNIFYSMFSIIKYFFYLQCVVRQY